MRKVYIYITNGFPVDHCVGVEVILRRHRSISRGISAAFTVTYDFRPWLPPTRVENRAVSFGNDDIQHCRLRTETHVGALFRRARCDGNKSPSTRDRQSSAAVLLRLTTVKHTGNCVIRDVPRRIDCRKRRAVLFISAAVSLPPPPPPYQSPLSNARTTGQDAYVIRPRPITTKHKTARGNPADNNSIKVQYKVKVWFFFIFIIKRQTHARDGERRDFILQ